MHPHLPGNEAMHDVPIFQLDLEGRIGEVLDYLTLHFNVIFPGHYWLFDHWRSLEVSFLQEAFILMRHDVGLNLGHEVHGYNDDNQQ